MCSLFLELGADPCARNLDGLLPIEMLFKEERLQVVDILRAFTPDFVQYLPSDDDDDQVMSHEMLLDFINSHAIDNPNGLNDD
jgi:hypothetical protein